MTAPRVLIRTDASARQGLGHLQRCQSLAAALEEQNWRCAFVIAGDAEVARRRGYEARALMSTPGSDGDLEETTAAARNAACRAVIVDSYDTGAAFFSGLRAAGFATIAIDDRAAFPFAAHLVINGGVHADTIRYESSSGDTEFLLGGAYALLRPAFRDLPPRKVPNRAGRVLVMLGGSDIRGLTVPILRELAEGTTLEITAVVGPLARNGPDVAAAALGWNARVDVVVSPDEVAPLMAAADLAVTAGGQTLYELAAAGVPPVVIVAAENQRPQCVRFEQLGFSRTAGDAADPDIAKHAGLLIARLTDDAEARTAAARAGRGVVDGAGASRVAARIAALAAAG